MELHRAFLRLPLTFDSERLAAEVAQFEEGHWRPHPEGHPGNSALSLVAVGGDPNEDGVKGEMRPTPHLERCPYLRQVLASFRAVWGRTRLMRLDGNAEATAHTDINYYWSQHTRVHVPIVTDPDVRFLCGDEEVHMAAGESWIFDTWRRHNVINPNPSRRIHLVADTVGSAEFWATVDRSGNGAESRFVPYTEGRSEPMAFESVNHPVVMSPAEQRELADLILRSLPEDNSPQREALTVALARLTRDWRAAWSRFGEGRDGWPLYRQLLKRTTADVESMDGHIRLRNGVFATEAVKSLLISPAMFESEAEGRIERPRPRARASRLDRPIFIVCSPRSGSTLFFETLSQSPSLWTIGGESHLLIEGITALHPAERRYHSNRLTAADATPSVVATLEERFLQNLRNRDGAAPRAGASGLRLLEKTPKNSLRVPFLAEAFPDARFVYLYRDMRDTISSMLDAWRSGKFVTYPALPGWEGLPWSLLLTPGWRELSGKQLAEVVAGQWSVATRYLLDDLEQLDPQRWCIASYASLVDNPQAEAERICRFVGIDWDRELTAPLPLSRTTLTRPDPEKWRHNAADLETALPLVEEVAARARALFAEPPPAETTQRTTTPRAVLPVPPPAPSGGSFRSVHTTSFGQILEAAGGSLVVTTYQSGRVVLLRPVAGGLNSHFRAFPSPMGVAVGANRIALGTKNNVWHFINHPALAKAMDDGKTDAAFVPTLSKTTGDIRIHELVFTTQGLIAVNTRFSCLVTFDQDNSFTPVWHPKFITELAPEDRCHLNGVCVIDGALRYVTALGTSNDKEGWRAAKASGGVIIEVATHEVIASGLSMPHSPRWYRDRLWVLESGEGRIGWIDPKRGKFEPVAEVPGFARGLAFAGDIAFVGLSQIREHVFDGLPIAARAERYCGVWAIDIRSGEIVAFLRFEGDVQEIFDIQFLAGIRHPDILEPTDPAVATSFVLDGRLAARPGA